MKKIDALICYDIADAKRLRQIAKIIERSAMRIQKSIFYLPGASHNELVRIVHNLQRIIDDEQDDIRIYRVFRSRSLHMCSGVDLNHPQIIGGKR